jgi:hypothetical protein
LDDLMTLSDRVGTLRLRIVWWIFHESHSILALAAL